MFRDEHRLAALLLAVVASTMGVAAHAQPSHRDASGDPLPAGAIARLGTVRMRHGQIISGVVFSGDGKSIVASDYYSGVHVWDAADGKQVNRFFGKADYCHRLAISPDGRTLAVALGDLTVRLCDPSSGHQFGSLPKQSNRMSALVFSPDGKRLATEIIGDDTVRIWDVASRRLIDAATFGERVQDFALSSDGKLLACSVGDGIWLWDLARRKKVRRLNNDPSGKHALEAVFAPDGGPIAVWGYDDGSIRLFDASSFKEIRRFYQEDANAKPTSPWGWASSIIVSFSPNGKILAVSRTVGRIELWDVDRGTKRRTIAFDSSQRPTFLAFSPDGGKLASAGSDNRGGDNTIRVWDVASGKEIRPSAGHASPISSVAISPDGKLIATAGREGVVHLWDAGSGKHLRRFDGHPTRRNHVCFSSDGRLISWPSYAGDGTLRIWNPNDERQVRRLELQNPNSFWDAVSGDGKIAVSVDLQAKQIRFHDLTTGKIIRESPDDFHRPIGLSPSGDKLVGLDGSLMTVADRKEYLHIGRAQSVMFSEDGRTLVAAVVAKRPYDFRSEPPAEEIAVIDPVGGRRLRRFGSMDGRFRAIDAAALSPDGRTVVTAGESDGQRDEQAITLWETETGFERGHFLGHFGQVNGVAISPDGRFVVSGADDTTAIIWDATRPLAKGVALRGRSATPELANCFRDLASDDAELAYASMWTLVGALNEAAAFLANQQSLFEKTDIPTIRQWIRNLDNTQYSKRERASRELGMILDEAEPHLKKALSVKPSPEARQRIERLLAARSRGPRGKELQRLRAMEVLEHIAGSGTDAVRRAARGALRKFAAGDPETHVTQEAKASLDRLQRRMEPKR